LARLGKIAEAKSLLKKNLARLEYSPYQNVYKTFEALLLIDHGDTAAGYQQLKKLAFDVDNQSQDMALYYLGTYELSQGNKDSAINIFNMIFSIRHINQVMSPWQELALQQLGELE
jgi:hypothetical protein